MRQLLRALGLAIGIGAAAASAAPAAGQTITEYEIPTLGAGPERIAAGPDGALWFTEDGANQIGRITTDGVVTEFSIPGSPSTGIAAGPDGAVWFTERDAAQIGRITPAGVTTVYAIPPNEFGHPWQPSQITAGSDGALWFTADNGFEGSLCRITTDGVATVVRTLGHYNHAGSLTSGPDGGLWFTVSGAFGVGWIARMAMDGALTRFPIGFAAWAIAVGGDGAFWFPHLAYASGTPFCVVGRMTTDGVVTNVRPKTCGNPYRWASGIAAGADGSLWLTETKSNQIARISTGGVVELPIPTASSSPRGIALGPDGALWFTEHDANKIARLTTTAGCALDRLCLQQGTIEIAARWTRGDGHTGVGHPVSLTDASGYFWFFEPGNVELVVKILNGCPVNGHSWFFAGGLTNLEIEVMVTNKATGQVETYTNLRGIPFAPIQDTEVFPCQALGVSGFDAYPP